MSETNALNLNLTEDANEALFKAKGCIERARAAAMDGGAPTRFNSADPILEEVALWELAAANKLIQKAMKQVPA